MCLAHHFEITMRGCGNIGSPMCACAHHSMSKLPRCKELAGNASRGQCDASCDLGSSPMDHPSALLNLHGEYRLLDCSDAS